MRTPLVVSQAAAEESFGETPTRETACDIEATFREKEQIEKCVVLVPGELYETLTTEELDQLLLPNGFQVREKKRPLSATPCNVACPKSSRSNWYTSSG